MTMSQPLLKITYLPLRGRAEITRLALAFGGFEFEDVRVQGAELAAIKPTLPLNQVPVLEVDGVVYAQSQAMARYAGRLSGLYPTEPIAALKVDMIMETLYEGQSTYVIINWKSPDETVKAERVKAFTEQGLPKIFGLLEKNVEGPYFLGEKASLADVYAFDLYNNQFKMICPNFTLGQYPKVEGIVARVAANPGIAAYLAKQP
jgi:prostaglandin-H2 D-isomerase / glutathione transferase